MNSFHDIRAPSTEAAFLRLVASAAQFAHCSRALHPDGVPLAANSMHSRKLLSCSIALRRKGLGCLNFALKSSHCLALAPLSTSHPLPVLLPKHASSRSRVAAHEKA